ncbi:MAG: histidine phosphatase family protein [Streptococcus sp.]
MHFGIFEGQPEYLHPKIQIQGHFGDHYAQFGGESQDQFVERVVNGAREIVDKHPNQSILAVSHAGALMTFLHAVEPERAFSLSRQLRHLSLLITMDRTFTLSN